MTRVGFAFAGLLIVVAIVYAVWPIHSHAHGISSYCGWPPAAAFADQNEYGLGPDCRDQGMKHLFVGGLLLAWADCSRARGERADATGQLTTPGTRRPVRADSEQSEGSPMSVRRWIDRDPFHVVRSAEPSEGRETVGGVVEMLEWLGPILAAIVAVVAVLITRRHRPL